MLAALLYSSGSGFETFEILSNIEYKISLSKEVNDYQLDAICLSPSYFGTIVYYLRRIKLHNYTVL